MVKETLIIGAVLVTGALLASRQLSAPRADIPPLNTPAWQGEAPKYGEQLLLRRDAQADAVLLLKHSAHEGAYRYDGSTRYLTSVTDQEWIRAGGTVAECGKQFPPPPQVLRINTQTHRLMAGQRDIPTAGPTVLALTESPSHRYVAVVSASGAAKPSLLPFLGVATEGQRFHQLVSLPDAAVLGRAIRIPVKRSEDVLAACWSPDEKAIVYYDTVFTYVSVVEL
jgi:hypothetical protein